MLGRRLTGVALVYAAAASTVLGVGVLGYASIRALVSAKEAQAHTIEVTAAIQRVGRLLKDAESARRGYVITADEVFATAYRRAASDLEGALSALTNRSIASRQQQRMVRELEPTIRQRLQLLSSSIEHHRAARDLDEASAATRAGLDLDVIIQRQLADAEAAGADLLEEQEQRASNRALRSAGWIAATSLVAAVLMAWASVTVARHRRRRRQAEEEVKEAKTLLDSVVNQMADGLVVADGQGRFRLFNPAAERLLGTGKVNVDPGQWAERYRVLRPDGMTPLPAAEVPLARALRGEDADDVELAIAHQSGVRWIRVTARPLRDEAGQVTGGLAVFRDVSDERRASAALQTAKESLEATVHQMARINRQKTELADLAEILHSALNVDEAYAVVSQRAPRLFPGSRGEIFTVNPSYNHMQLVGQWGSGATAPGSEVIHDPVECWGLRRGIPHLQGPSGPGPRCQHLGSPAGGDDIHLCIPHLGADGPIGLIHVIMPAAALPERGGDEAEEWGRELLETAASLAHVVTPELLNIRLRDKLRAQSIRDPLTGLYNRRYMEESLGRELKRAGRAERPVGVIMLDVDHFKRFNDEHGHAAGDTALREFGTVLQAQIRGGDIACRYGGEEFTIVLPEASLENTRRRAEEIRVAVAALVVRLPDGKVVSITVSQGVAAFPGHGESGETLLHAADRALYRAKRLGRNRVECAEAPAAPADAGRALDAE
jgi:diguanylate cyclase (GGDEF)-like protein